MSTNHWWETRAKERYWLEATGRLDIGADLRAPLFDDSGKPNWRYSLFRSASVGDFVFHYDTNAAAITGLSMIAGGSYEHPIVWGARGSYARRKGTNKPHERPGYIIPLSQYRSIDPVIDLGQIRKLSGELKRITSNLAHESASPIYFPFELSAKREPRLLQGYAFKLPLAFIELFPILQAAVVDEDQDRSLSMPVPELVVIDPESAQDDDPELSGEEGQKRMRSHMVRERDRRLIAAKKKQVQRITGKLACEACGFDFGEAYGKHGEGIIDCHHVVPLSSIIDTQVTRLEDLALLCANCHRIVHRRRQWLTMEQLLSALART
jgi:hypothetical protein